jgi:hypothetical protein
MKILHSATIFLILIKDRQMRTYITKTLIYYHYISLRYVSSHRGPSSGSTTDTFQQQNQQSELTEGVLTLILLTSTKWWASASASKWRMGFNSAFKGLTI